METIGVLKKKYIGLAGCSIRVSDYNFTVPRNIKVSASRGDTVSVEWSKDRDGTMIVESVEEISLRHCSHCNKMVPLKCADPSGNLDVGFCNKSYDSQEAKDGD